jgi:hypothetical protein
MSVYFINFMYNTSKSSFFEKIFKLTNLSNQSPFYSLLKGDLNVFNFLL